MSRFMDTFLKLLFTNPSSSPERVKGEPAMRRSRSRGRKRRSSTQRVGGGGNGRRDRSVQYADSFIFLPFESPLPRTRANTCATDLTVSSSSSSPRRLSSLLKSRISSQEVEDINTTHEGLSFQEPLYHRLSDFDQTDHHVANTCNNSILHRPLSCHSLGLVEYTTPSDCIQRSARWYYSEDDLESNTGLD